MIIDDKSTGNIILNVISKYPSELQVQIKRMWGRSPLDPTSWVKIVGLSSIAESNDDNSLWYYVKYNPTAYVGLIVSVVDDPIEANNGAYYITGVSENASFYKFVKDVISIVNMPKLDFVWGKTTVGNTIKLQIPSSKEDDDVYIGVICDYPNQTIDFVLPDLNDLVEISTLNHFNVSQYYSKLGKDQEELTFTCQSDDLETDYKALIFVTTDKIYYDWLCSTLNADSELGENRKYGDNLVSTGFDNYKYSFDYYYHFISGTRIFYISADTVFNGNLYKTPHLLIITGLINDYTTEREFFKNSDYITIPLGSSSGAFNFIDSITEFPESYNTGDMWYINSESISVTNGITILGGLSLTKGDFLLCVNDENKQFAVILSNITGDFPSASSNSPENISSTSDKGQNINYAREDHVHALLVSDKIPNGTILNFDSNNHFSATNTVILGDTALEESDDCHLSLTLSELKSDKDNGLLYYSVTRDTSTIKPNGFQNFRFRSKKSTDTNPTYSDAKILYRTTNKPSPSGSHEFTFLAGYDYETKGGEGISLPKESTSVNAYVVVYNNSTSQAEIHLSFNSLMDVNKVVNPKTWEIIGPLTLNNSSDEFDIYAQNPIVDTTIISYVVGTEEEANSLLTYLNRLIITFGYIPAYYYNDNGNEYYFEYFKAPDLEYVILQTVSIEESHLTELTNLFEYIPSGVKFYSKNGLNEYTRVNDTWYKKEFML